MSFPTTTTFISRHHARIVVRGTFQSSSGPASQQHRPALMHQLIERLAGILKSVAAPIHPPRLGWFISSFRSTLVHLRQEPTSSSPKSLNAFCALRHARKKSMELDAWRLKNFVIRSVNK